MTIEPNPHVLSDEEAKTLWSETRNLEEFLAELRALGANKIECIRAVHLLGECSLGQAKDKVHCSAAWQDRRTSDEAFHESVYEALDHLQHEHEVARKSDKRLAS